LNLKPYIIIKIQKEKIYLKVLERKRQMGKIYTIGHSNHSTEYFLELLRKYDIDSIVDIRSVPFSRYVPHFNKDIIRRILQVNKINCIYMGKELGIVQQDKTLYSGEGYPDFEKVRESSDFLDGTARIKNGTEKGYRIALMCTEKDPLDCHRSILITREFKDQGYEVTHILPDGSSEDQDGLEKRLLQLYFPEESEHSLFHILDKEKYIKELLTLAYRKRNKDLWKLRK
jgi:uncharacterized protein (DUF488 family)